MNKSAIAAAVAVAFAAPAFAQESAEKIQRVEITGSSIKQSAREAAGAVTTLTRADIERTGQTSALGVLTQIAAIDANINSATASSGSFATGSSGIELRNLGKVSTLILVNGQRIAPYGLADGAQENFTNLDAIAADSIERIEVLKDGASAIYGSDAIAGVVNLILRKDFVGARVKANVSQADHFRDQRTRSVSGIFGFGDLDQDGFNTYLAVEGRKSDGWSTGDLRDNGLIPAWHRLTPGRSTWDAKSTFSPAGNYLLGGKVVASPNCPADAIDPVDKACKWDQYYGAGQTTDNKRWAITSNTHFRIGSSIDANFEITAAGATTDYIVAPFATSNGSSTTSSNVWYNAIGAKQVGPYFYPKLPVGHPMNLMQNAAGQWVPGTAPVEYRARLMDTGDGFNFNKTDSEQSRFMLRLAGSLGDYDWKSAVGYSTSEATKATRAVSAVGYTDAIVKGTYKFGQQNDPALLESMFPVRTTAGKSKNYFMNGTISGEAFQLPAGPVGFAIGADIRRENYEMASSDNVLRGDLVGIAGLQVDDAQTQYSLFGEANAPLLKNLEMNLAVRADKSSNFDAHISPKLGLKFTPVDGLIFRATASGGFRAPNIVETGNGLGRSSFANNTIDPRRCPIATTLNNLVQNAAGATTADKQRANTFRNSDCLAGVPTFVTANPDLKPETSKTFTAGVFWEPIKGTWVSLDYYNIERKDEIGTRSPADVLRDEANLPAGQLTRVNNTAADNEFLALVQKYVPGNAVNFGGVGALGLLLNPYVNSGKTKTSGFDFAVENRGKIPNVGDYSIKVDGEYRKNYQTFDVGAGKYGPNYFGTYDLGSKLIVYVRPNLKVGAFDHGLTVRFLSSYTNSSEDSPNYCVEQKVAAENMAACDKVKPPKIVDYNVSYRGFKNVVLSGYINNLFDKDQSVKWRGGWSQTSLGLRTFGASASYQF
ncbi:TonB-dependent receptor [Pseudoduganella sp. DS3]|uniref:TonB-dependent receptor n=1 Tax=Pseudoduganella guangdongensis TaxID=2692179 RepID=A0A6N9HQD0_9BURK|nr:TonB-dependent receptor [Pseudoduganella guangdongensis]MYN05679.1 TonB-dependent receptor [Pseudoduganella guangdongensis]